MYNTKVVQYTLESIQYLILGWELKAKYSSVPNRRVGRNKHAGGKILKKH